MGAVPRPIATIVFVIASFLANTSLVISAQAAGPDIEQRQKAWREAISRTPPQRRGCFRASYPLTVWRQVNCVTVPSVHVSPRAARQQGGLVLGHGTDYVAVSKTPISFTVGHFPVVKHLKWEAGADGVPNLYSLQLNSNFIPNDPVCSGASDPKKCLGWAQFIFLNSKNKNKDKDYIYIQYWLNNYGSGNCPDGGWKHPDDPLYKDYCFLTVGAAQVPPQPITELPNLILSGGAVAQGLDTVELITKTQAYSTAAPDNTVYLANAWIASEFNVFGDDSGHQANFNPETSLAVEVLLTNGSTDKPKCKKGKGTTAETNNLSLGKCRAKGGMFPSIQFAEKQGATFNVLYSFQSGSDGNEPDGGVVMDGGGNLYGTTYYGGGGSNDGTVFKLAADGTETVLYSFQGGSDGANPDGGVVMDGEGNLYGTTPYGGAHNVGTVFRIASDGTETVLHTFAGSDGAYPNVAIIMDGQGNLYGTTNGGGRSGYGTVFKLAPNGTETVLYSFRGESDGADPLSLIMDGQGNLYGTTDGVPSGGIVFKLAPDGTETVLYTFQGGDNDLLPTVSIMDSQGNLYGTTVGTDFHLGTIFKLAPDGTETVLHSFQGGSDGANPSGGVFMDGEGNLYGTTRNGGEHNVGIVFRLTPNGNETVLHSFTGSDGAHPGGGVIMDGRGNLYGTTSDGGSYDGTIFKLTP